MGITKYALLMFLLEVTLVGSTLSKNVGKSWMCVEILGVIREDESNICNDLTAHNIYIRMSIYPREKLRVSHPSSAGSLEIREEKGEERVVEGECRDALRYINKSVVCDVDHTYRGFFLLLIAVGTPTTPKLLLRKSISMEYGDHEYRETYPRILEVSPKYFLMGSLLAPPSHMQRERAGNPIHHALTLSNPYNQGDSDHLTKLKVTVGGSNYRLPTHCLLFGSGQEEIRLPGILIGGSGYHCLLPYAFYLSGDIYLTILNGGVYTNFVQVYGVEQREGFQGITLTPSVLESGQLGEEEFSIQGIGHPQDALTFIYMRLSGSSEIFIATRGLLNTHPSTTTLYTFTGVKAPKSLSTYNIKLEFSMNNIEFYYVPCTIRVHPTPVIYSFSPLEVRGSQPFTIRVRGTNFYRSEEGVKCRFGGEYVSLGEVLDSQWVVCRGVIVKGGNRSLGVEIGFYNGNYVQSKHLLLIWEEVEALYEYSTKVYIGDLHTPASPDSSTPNIYHNHSPLSIYIHITLLPPALNIHNATFTCLYKADNANPYDSDTITNAYFINNQTLTCTIPSIKYPGVYFFSLLDQYANSPVHQLKFNYLQIPKINSINMNSLNEIIIHIERAIYHGESSWVCSFGGKYSYGISSGVILDQMRISCGIPINMKGQYEDISTSIQVSSAWNKYQMSEEYAFVYPGSKQMFLTPLNTHISPDSQLIITLNPLIKGIIDGTHSLKLNIRAKYTILISITEIYINECNTNGEEVVCSTPNLLYEREKVYIETEILVDSWSFQITPNLPYIHITPNYIHSISPQIILIDNKYVQIQYFRIHLKYLFQDSSYECIYNNSASVIGIKQKDLLLCRAPEEIKIGYLTINIILDGNIVLNNDKQVMLMHTPQLVPISHYLLPNAFPQIQILGNLVDNITYLCDLRQGGQDTFERVELDTSTNLCIFEHTYTQQSAYEMNILYFNNGTLIGFSQVYNLHVLPLPVITNVYPQIIYPRKTNIIILYGQYLQYMNTSSIKINDLPSGWSITKTQFLQNLNQMELNVSQKVDITRKDSKIVELEIIFRYLNSSRIYRSNTGILIIFSPQPEIENWFVWTRTLITLEGTNLSSPPTSTGQALCRMRVYNAKYLAAESKIPPNFLTERKVVCDIKHLLNRMLDLHIKPLELTLGYSINEKDWSEVVIPMEDNILITLRNKYLLFPQDLNQDLVVDIGSEGEWVKSIYLHVNNTQVPCISTYHAINHSILNCNLSGYMSEYIYSIWAPNTQNSQLLNLLFRSTERYLYKEYRMPIIYSPVLGEVTPESLYLTEIGFRNPILHIKISNRNNLKAQVNLLNLKPIIELRSIGQGVDLIWYLEIMNINPEGLVISMSKYSSSIREAMEKKNTTVFGGIMEVKLNSTHGLSINSLPLYIVRVMDPTNKALDLKGILKVCPPKPQIQIESYTTYTPKSSIIIEEEGNVDRKVFSNYSEATKLHIEVNSTEDITPQTPQILNNIPPFIVESRPLLLILPPHTQSTFCIQMSIRNLSPNPSVLFKCLGVLSNGERLLTNTVIEGNGQVINQTNAICIFSQVHIHNNIKWFILSVESGKYISNNHSIQIVLNNKSEGNLVKLLGRDIQDNKIIIEDGTTIDSLHFQKEEIYGSEILWCYIHNTALTPAIMNTTTHKFTCHNPINSIYLGEVLIIYKKFSVLSNLSPLSIWDIELEIHRIEYTDIYSAPPDYTKLLKAVEYSHNITGSSTPNQFKLHNLTHFYPSTIILDDGIGSEEYIINFTFIVDKIDIISGDSKCWISGLNTIFRVYKIEEVFGCSCNISTKLIGERNEIYLRLVSGENIPMSNYQIIHIRTCPKILSIKPGILFKLNAPQYTRGSSPSIYLEAEIINFSSSTQDIGFSINRQLLSTSEGFPILSRGIPNTYRFKFPDGIRNLNLEFGGNNVIEVEIRIMGSNYIVKECEGKGYSESIDLVEIPNILYVKSEVIFEDATRSIFVDLDADVNIYAEHIHCSLGGVLNPPILTILNTTNTQLECHIPWTTLHTTHNIHNIDNQLTIHFSIIFDLISIPVDAPITLQVLSRPSISAISPETILYPNKEFHISMLNSPFYLSQTGNIEFRMIISPLYSISLNTTSVSIKYVNNTEYVFTTPDTLIANTQYYMWIQIMDNNNGILKSNYLGPLVYMKYSIANVTTRTKYLYFNQEYKEISLCGDNLPVTSPVFLYYYELRNRDINLENERIIEYYLRDSKLNIRELEIFPSIKQRCGVWKYTTPANTKYLTIIGKLSLFRDEMDYFNSSFLSNQFLLQVVEELIPLKILNPVIIQTSSIYIQISHTLSRDIPVFCKINAVLGDAKLVSNNIMKCNGNSYFGSELEIGISMDEYHYNSIAAVYTRIHNLEPVFPIYIPHAVSEISQIRVYHEVYTESLEKSRIIDNLEAWIKFPEGIVRKMEILNITGWSSESFILNIRLGDIEEYIDLYELMELPITITQNPSELLMSSNLTLGVLHFPIERERARVMSISPAAIQENTKSLLHVYGENFQRGGYMCRFNGLVYREGIMRNSTYFICLTPQIHIYEYKFEFIERISRVAIYTGTINVLSTLHIKHVDPTHLIYSKYTTSNLEQNVGDNRSIIFKLYELNELGEVAVRASAVQCTLRGNNLEEIEMSINNLNSTFIQLNEFTLKQILPKIAVYGEKEIILKCKYKLGSSLGAAYSIPLRYPFLVTELFPIKIMLNVELINNCYISTHTVYDASIQYFIKYVTNIYSSEQIPLVYINDQFRYNCSLIQTTAQIYISGSIYGDLEIWSTYNKILTLEQTILKGIQFIPEYKIIGAKYFNSKRDYLILELEGCATTIEPIGYFGSSDNISLNLVEKETYYIPRYQTLISNKCEFSNNYIINCQFEHIVGGEKSIILFLGSNILTYNISIPHEVFTVSSAHPLHYLMGERINIHLTLREHNLTMYTNIYLPKYCEFEGIKIPMDNPRICPLYLINTRIGNLIHVNSGILSKNLVVYDEQQRNIIASPISITIFELPKVSLIVPTLVQYNESQIIHLGMEYKTEYPVLWVRFTEFTGLKYEVQVLNSTAVWFEYTGGIIIESSYVESTLDISVNQLAWITLPIKIRFEHNLHPVLISINPYLIISSKKKEIIYIEGRNFHISKDNNLKLVVVSKTERGVKFEFNIYCFLSESRISVEVGEWLRPGKYRVMLVYNNPDLVNIKYSNEVDFIILEQPRVINTGYYDGSSPTNNIGNIPAFAQSMHLSIQVEKLERGYGAKYLCNIGGTYMGEEVGEGAEVRCMLPPLPPGTHKGELLIELGEKYLESLFFVEFRVVGKPVIQEIVSGNMIPHGSDMRIYVELVNYVEDVSYCRFIEEEKQREGEEFISTYYRKYEIEKRPPPAHISIVDYLLSRIPKVSLLPTSTSGLYVCIFNPGEGISHTILITNNEGVDLYDQHDQHELRENLAATLSVSTFSSKNKLYVFRTQFQVPNLLIFSPGEIFRGNGAQIGVSLHNNIPQGYYPLYKEIDLTCIFYKYIQGVGASNLHHHKYTFGCEFSTPLLDSILLYLPKYSISEGYFVLQIYFKGPNIYTPIHEGKFTVLPSPEFNYIVSNYLLLPYINQIYLYGNNLDISSHEDSKCIILATQLLPYETSFDGKFVSIDSNHAICVFDLTKYPTPQHLYDRLSMREKNELTLKLEYKKQLISIGCYSPECSALLKISMFKISEASPEIISYPVSAPKEKLSIKVSEGENVWNINSERYSIEWRCEYTEEGRIVWIEEGVVDGQKIICVIPNNIEAKMELETYIRATITMKEPTGYSSSYTSSNSARIYTVPTPLISSISPHTILTYSHPLILLTIKGANFHRMHLPSNPLLCRVGDTGAQEAIYISHNEVHCLLDIRSHGVTSGYLMLSVSNDQGRLYNLHPSYIYIRSHNIHISRIISPNYYFLGSQIWIRAEIAGIESESTPSPPYSKIELILRSKYERIRGVCGEPWESSGRECGVFKPIHTGTYEVFLGVDELYSQLIPTSYSLSVLNAFFLEGVSPLNVIMGESVDISADIGVVGSEVFTLNPGILVECLYTTDHLGAPKRETGSIVTRSSVTGYKEVRCPISFDTSAYAYIDIRLLVEGYYEPKIKHPVEEYRVRLHERATLTEVTPSTIYEHLAFHRQYALPVLYLTGCHFYEGTNMECVLSPHFDNIGYPRITIPAQYVSPTEIYCMLGENIQKGDYQLKFRNAHLGALSPNYLQLQILRRPFISDVAPRVGKGGSAIAITGVNFNSHLQYSCTFDNSLNSIAIFGSSTSLSCKIPIIHTLTTIFINIKLDDSLGYTHQLEGSSYIQFEYIPYILPKSIKPSKIPLGVTGEMLVATIEDDLTNKYPLECIFGEGLGSTSAYINTDHEIRCLIPVNSESSGSRVSLSMRIGVSVYIIGYFEYFSNPIITEVTPNSVIEGYLGPIFVTGNTFQSTDYLICVFENGEHRESTNGVYINSTLIECYLPTNISNIFPISYLEISVDGGNYLCSKSPSDIINKIEIKKRPLMNKEKWSFNVALEGGVEGGEFTLNVEGRHFSSLEPSNSKCVFNEVYSSPVNIVSDSALSCIVPNELVTPEMATLKLMGSNSVYYTQFHIGTIHFVAFPTLTKTSPSLLPAQGGRKVYIQGIYLDIVYSNSVLVFTGITHLKHIIYKEGSQYYFYSPVYPMGAQFSHTAKLYILSATGDIDSLIQSEKINSIDVVFYSSLQITALQTTQLYGIGDNIVRATLNNRLINQYFTCALGKIGGIPLIVTKNILFSTNNDLECIFKGVLQEGVYCLQVSQNGLEYNPDCNYQVTVHHPATISYLARKIHPGSYKLDFDIFGSNLNSKAWFCYFVITTAKIPQKTIVTKGASIPISDNQIVCKFTDFLKYYQENKYVHLKGISNVEDYFYNQLINWKSPLLSEIMIKAYLLSVTPEILHSGSEMKIRGLFIPDNLNISVIFRHLMDSNIILKSASECLQTNKANNIICISPTFLTSGYYSIGLVDSEEEMINDNKLLRVLIVKEPVVVDIEETTHSVADSSYRRILKVETEPIDSLNVVHTTWCKIGPYSYSVKGTWRGLTQIICPINSTFHIPKQLCIEISLNDGYDYTTSCTLKIHSIRPPVITTITPLSARRTTKGNIILIHGTGFKSLDTYYCKFARSDGLVDFVVKATFLSYAGIKCSFQSSVLNETYTGTISILFHYFPIKTHGFVFYEPNLIERISPYYGVRSGGTEITAHGHDFVDEGSIKCRFSLNFDVLDTSNEHFSPANWVSSKEVKCQTPDVSSEMGAGEKYQHYYVSVSDIDGRYSLSITQFIYIQTPTILSLLPNSGFITQHTSVLVSGTHFYNLPTLSVKFIYSMGEVVREALFMSDSLVSVIVPTTFDVPQLVAYDVIIEISNTGEYDFSRDNIWFHLISVPSIVSIMPPKGGIFGGTVVEIKGSNFDPAVKYCKFENSIVSATYIDQHGIECMTPYSAGGIAMAARVALVYENDVTFTEREVYFNYEDMSIIQKILPSEYHIGGGIIATIHGQFAEFMNKEIKVFFGQVQSIQVYQPSATEIKTMIPDSGGIVDKKVDLTIEVDTADYLNELVSFQYLAYGSSGGIDPPLGPSSGGTMVTVAGSGFQNFNKIFCVFDQSFTQGVFISPSILECETPTHLPGYVSFKLIFNGLFEKDNGLSFLYYDNMEIQSVDPVYIRIIGGPLITLKGRNFMDLPLLYLSVGPYKLKPNFMNSTTLNFSAPAAEKFGKVLTLYINILAYDWYKYE